MSSSRREKVVVRNLTKVYPAGRWQGVRARWRGAADAGRDLEAAGGTVAVRDVSFSVDAGETFVVMGLSGSGKSTLIRCMNRLVAPTKGEVYIDGEDVLAADGKRLREIRMSKAGMVFQHFALFPHKTVVENVEYGLKVRRLDPRTRRRRALEILAQVGLSDWAAEPPVNLSGGMQQRVGLARALAVDPEVLLMDEPFSALDPLIRRDMQRELVELQRRERKTIVFITHDLHEALTLGDRVAIMRAGRFVQVGAPQDIVAQPADDYVAAFTKDVDRGRVFTVRDAMKAAETLVRDQDDPAAAAAQLRRTGARGVHVVGADGRPVGLVVAADMAGRQPRSGGLASIMRRDFPRAAAEASLAEVYPACATGLPIAVVDDSGQLAGTLDPLDVFSMVAGEADRLGTREPGETAVPAAGSG